MSLASEAHLMSVRPTGITRPKRSRENSFPLLNELVRLEAASWSRYVRPWWVVDLVTPTRFLGWFTPSYSNTDVWRSAV